MASNIFRKVNKSALVYFMLIVVLTLPRSVNDISESAAFVLNVAKVLSALVIVGLILRGGAKLSKFSKIFITYFAFVTVVTIMNGVDPIVALKTYGLNSAMLLLVDVIFSSESRNNVINAFTNYLVLLLVVNFVQICAYIILGVTTEWYLLGLDNRFILYILPAIIGCHYLDIIRHKTSMSVRTILVYVIGLLSTLLTWSVAAFIVVAVIAVAIVAATVIKRFRARFNIKIVAVCELLTSALLVTTKFHTIFEPVIVGVLHKNMSLSYRTFMWDVALDLMKTNPLNVFVGFGFFDYSGILSVLPFAAARVNHFHNLLVDIMFASGIIGLIVYLFGLFTIFGTVQKIKNAKPRSYFGIVLMGILLLLAFESFELYQVYYCTLALLNGCSLVIDSECRKRKKQELANE